MAQGPRPVRANVASIRTLAAFARWFVAGVRNGANHNSSDRLPCRRGRPRAGGSNRCSRVCAAACRCWKLRRVLLNTTRPSRPSPFHVIRAARSKPSSPQPGASSLNPNMSRMRTMSWLRSGKLLGGPRYTPKRVFVSAPLPPRRVSKDVVFAPISEHSVVPQRSDPRPPVIIEERRVETSAADHPTSARVVGADLGGLIDLGTWVERPLGKGVKAYVRVRAELAQSRKAEDRASDKESSGRGPAPARSVLQGA